MSSQSTISPILPDEAGHLAATRLTPDAYPFVVERIEYTAGSPDVIECNGGLSHRVEVYVSKDAAPSTSPSQDGTLVDTITVAAEEGAAAPHVRWVSVELNKELVLQEGESVYIAVEQAGNDSANPTEATCLVACSAPGSVSGVDFWSNAIMGATYSWADMVADFGFSQNFDISVVGHVE
jgi:hypothetical protein